MLKRSCIFVIGECLDVLARLTRYILLFSKKKNSNACWNEEAEARIAQQTWKCVNIAKHTAFIKFTWKEIPSNCQRDVSCRLEASTNITMFLKCEISPRRKIRKKKNNGKYFPFLFFFAFFSLFFLVGLMET